MWLLEVTSKEHAMCVCETFPFSQFHSLASDTNSEAIFKIESKWSALILN